MAGLNSYPQFEKGSLSAQYQQIINYCVNYTEGLLISQARALVPGGGAEAGLALESAVLGGTTEQPVLQARPAIVKPSISSTSG